jgi:hypothetical protein
LSLKIWMSFIFKNRLVMNFKITTLILLCIKNLYVNSKTNDIIVSKLKLKNSPMFQMNFVKIIEGLQTLLQKWGGIY